MNIGWMHKVKTLRNLLQEFVKVKQDEKNPEEKKFRATPPGFEPCPLGSKSEELRHIYTRL